MKKLNKKCIAILLIMFLMIGIIPTTALANQANDIVSVASSQIGHVGGSYYGAGSSPWCAYFVSWCARQKQISTDIIPATGNCDTMYNGVINGGGLVVTSPQKGDLLFYKSYSGGTYAHVGIMSSSTLSIQGNVNNKVLSISPLAYYYSSTQPSKTTDIKYVRPLYKPDTPASVKASSSSYSSIKISWNAVSGATGYNIYQATSSTGTYQKIGVTTSTFYNKTGLITGKTYYYKVRAYKTLTGTVNRSSDYSAVVSCKPVLNVPSNFTATRNSSNTSTILKWSAVPGATGYEIYRLVEGEAARILDNKTSLTYTDGSLLSPQNITRDYSYKVRAYRTINGVKIPSNWTSLIIRYGF
jgi:hypothetical protein